MLMRATSAIKQCMMGIKDNLVWGVVCGDAFLSVQDVYVKSLVALGGSLARCESRMCCDR